MYIGTWNFVLKTDYKTVSILRSLLRWGTQRAGRLLSTLPLPHSIFCNLLSLLKPPVLSSCPHLADDLLYFLQKDS